jgi:hypothetical protein
MKIITEEQRLARNAKVRAYAAANREKVLQRKREYYKKNKFKFSDYWKEYRKHNREKIRARQRKWEEKNIDHVRDKAKQYQIENKERIAAMAAARYRANPEPKKARERARRQREKDRMKIRDKEYRQTHKEQLNKASNHRYATNQFHRIKHLLRSRLNIAMRGKYKSGSAVDLLGCAIPEFIQHIEKQFEPWMNWNNRGRAIDGRLTWQIDHIKPLGAFDITDPIELGKACHFSNLQPLESQKNISKRDKIPGDFTPPEIIV